MGYFDEAKQELAHHGIKGQRWGVRRFQNKDGSLTAEGKAKKKKKYKHEFKDYSASKSTRGEAYGALAASLAVFGGTTALNAATLGAGFLTGGGILLEVLSGVATVATAGDVISGEVKNAVANKKEKKFKAERDQNPIDKTTGFHKKTKEMTAKEDMERVNPAFKNWDENTKNNCFLCTMSMELRRRGYDVQAKKATEGYDADILVKDYFKGAKPKQSPGSMSDAEILSHVFDPFGYSIPSDRKKKMVEATIKDVESQKDGARGQMTCVWDGTASGHAFSYANEGGKLVIYDTQANKRYDGDAAREYLEKCSQIQVTRLDKCALNTKYIKEVAE